MAHLVAAFGTSHSPALNSPTEDFVEHARRDETSPTHQDKAGNATTFAALLRDADPAIATEIAPDRIRARVAACARHVERLADAIAAARLDALVIVGDDQREQYRDDNLPAFLVYWGEKITNTVSDVPDSAPEYWKRARMQYHEVDGPRDYPVAAALGRHVIETLTDREFDVAHGRTLPRARGEGHAFGFVHRRLLREPVVPVLPIAVNTYFPPNQPRPGRCLQLGRALRAAIETWPRNERIGVIASGGLSHFTVNEELDRGVLDACRAGAGERLAAIPPAQLNSGNSEIRNWIVTAGAAEGLRMRWLAYEPFYRTRAGTGCGMAFAEWGE
jgi:Catalytic LigB subunit of aromatic ring-opening dioxygenase